MCRIFDTLHLGDVTNQSQNNIVVQYNPNNKLEKSVQILLSQKGNLYVIYVYPNKKNSKK